MILFAPVAPKSLLKLWLSYLYFHLQFLFQATFSSIQLHVCYT